MPAQIPKPVTISVNILLTMSKTAYQLTYYTSRYYLLQVLTFSRYDSWQILARLDWKGHHKSKTKHRCFRSNLNQFSFKLKCNFFVNIVRYSQIKASMHKLLNLTAFWTSHARVMFTFFV